MSPAEPLSLVTALSEAIREVAGLVRELVAGAQVRRLKYQVEAARNYIFVEERQGQYKEITELRRQEYLVHFRKRVFDE